MRSVYTIVKIGVMQVLFLLPLFIHAQTFVHPGIPFTRSDLNQLKANIATDPWKTQYANLAGDSKSSLNYGMQGPFSIVSRAIDINRTQWENDMVAIHNLTFMYVFTGDTAYARKATNMLNAWAVTNTTWGGDESFLDLGDYSKYYVTAADILRSTYPGWTATNTANVKNWFANVLWPQLDVPNPTRGQNQGAIQLEAAVSIAAFLDDPVKWQQAIASWRNDAGGGISNSLTNGEVGDAGRDEGHWAGQVQALAWSAEVAWNQGVDLFGDLDNRVLGVTELYTHFHQDTTGLRYLNFGGPYASYAGWGSNGTNKRLNETYNIIEGAYVIRKGIQAPWTMQMRNLLGDNSFTFLYHKTSDSSIAAAPPALVHPAATAVTRLVNTDIGNVGLAGSAVYNNGVWTLKGAGSIPVPTLTSADACNFAFQKITGDGVVITRVASIDQANTTAKTGVMIRDSLGNNARYVGLFLNQGGGAVVTWRNAVAWSKTATSWNNAPGGYQDHYLPAVPYWLKLEKIGSRISAYHSFDGSNWTCISSIETGITGAVYAGVCVTSNNTSSLSTATFTNLSLTNAAPAGSPVITSAAADTATVGAAYSYTITASGSPVSYSATGLPAGLTIDSTSGVISGTPTAPGNYLVTLNATNSNGTGSAQLALTLLSNVAPAAPGSLTLAKQSNTSIQLSWNASANATSYTVKRSLTSGGPYTVIVNGVSGTSYTDANAYPGTNYYIVTALAGSLESAQSNEVFIQLPPSVPAKPAVTNGANKVVLDWPAATGAATYNIKRSSTSGGSYAVIASGVTSAHYADSGLVNGAYYYYVVSSVNGSMESANSQEVMGVPGASSNTWSPTATTGNWNTATNWVSGTVPVTPALINFDSSAVTNLTNDISSLEVSRLQFDSTAVTDTISGNAITLGNDITNNSTRSQVINFPITINRTSYLNATSGALTLGGVISGSGGIVRNGFSQVALSGANTYSGNTIINGGTGAGGWPPNYAMSITGSGTGAIGAPLTGPLGTGTVIMNGGSLLNTGTAVIFNDVLVKDSVTSYMYSNAGGLTLSGRLLGAGTLVHDGNSTNGFHLNGDNSGFTGTFISINRSSNHRIRFDNASAGSASANWIFNNSFTDGQGFTFTGTIRFGSLSGNGQLRRDNGTPVISIGALNTNTTFSGVITLGLNIVKEGTGTLRLTGSNSYSGTTTVTAGTLLIDSTGYITSVTTVNAGTIGGIGTLKNNLTIGTGSGTGAILAAGSNGIGTFTSTGTLTMNTDATYALEMSSSGDSADKVVAASVVLNNPVLSVTDVRPGNLVAGASFTIIDNSGTSPVTGTFKGLSEMAIINISSVDFRITYKGGTGNDVVLFDNRTAPAIITSADSATVVAGKSFSYTITAVNSPTSFGATGLPAGLTIDSTSGIISGVPTVSGVFPVVLRTTNANGMTTHTLTLTVISNIPGGVIVASGDAKDILDWNAIPNMSYTVKRSTISGGPYTTLGTTATTRFIDSSGVTNGSTYFYVVAATDSAGQYPNSAEVTAKPNTGQWGYYGFDEASGTSGIDAWGGNHGTLASTAKRDTGYFKTALKLDGTSTSYASLPTGEVSALNNFTISAWVKMTAISTWMRVFDFGFGTNTYMFFTVQGATSSGKSMLRYAIKYNGSAEQGLNYYDSFPLNTWRHLALTQSGNTVTMYINGKAVASGTNFTYKPSTLGSTTQNYIGKSQWSADPYFKGSIDEFKIYSRALSAAEIAQAMKVDQVITFDSIAPKLVGDSDFVASVTSTSTLPITLTSADTSIASIVNGKIHIVGAGTTGITASQAADTLHRAATPVTRQLTVSKRTQTITFDSIPNKLVGDSDFVVSVAASSSLPVTLASSDTTIAQIVNGAIHIVAAGTVNITASQNGNYMYLAAAPVIRALTISKRTQTITFDSIPNKLVGDSDFVVSASASSSLPVTLASSDTTIAQIVNGAIHIVAAGTANITASQNGNYMYLVAAPVTKAFTISKRTQTITFDSIPVKTIGDSDFVASVSASSSLPVTLTSSDTTVAQIVNGKIHIVAVGTANITASQYGNYMYYAASSVTQPLTINKKTQVITFDSIPVKVIGDSDFVVTASASSSLPVRFTSSDTTVAVVKNSVVHILNTGSTIITAIQDGTDTFSVATVARTLNVRALNLTVLSMDGDSGKVSNNVIKPYLMINNQDSIAVNYNELTARYWFTAENYAGINTWIDYAQLGSSNVKMKYVMLDTPRNGALGYVEYSFVAGIGKLPAGTNSGVIQSRMANTDWSALNEVDDYSYISNLTYTLNNHITLYRNGMLVYGTEPVKVAPVIALKAYSQSKSSAQNTISSYLQLNNTGNVPVNYKDIKVRYWFTEDGTTGLQYWVDYAKLGVAHIFGQFVSLSPVLNLADHYLEFKVDSALGSFYPLSNTGTIQYRIAKTDWSNFSQTNDYSYLHSNSLVENDHITVYYKGQLIYGTEPGAVGTREALNTASANETETGDATIAVYPNPVTTNLVISTGTIEDNAFVQVYNSAGTLVLTKRITGTATVISANNWKADIYWIKVFNGNKVAVKKVVKL